jgi:anti-anti-sigma factor
MEHESDRRTVAPLVIPEIVTWPAEVDLANSGQVAEELTAAFRPGVRVVIADLSATRYCDSSGMRVLLLAHDAALAHEAELRLVIPPSAVLRALTILGFDRLLQIYPSLEAALTGAPGR